MENDRLAKIAALAEKLLANIQRHLFMKYRFLEAALYRLKPKIYTAIPGAFGTDGFVLQYDAEWLLQRYQKASDREIRRFLHTILHCIYGHPFMAVPLGSDADARLWELSCDIVVEVTIITQLGGYPLQEDSEKTGFVYRFKEALRLLTVHEVYKYLQKYSFDIKALEKMFSMDCHFWRDKREKENQGNAGDDGAAEKGTSAGGTLNNVCPCEGEIAQGDFSFASMQEAGNSWNDIARNILVEMKMFQAAGSTPGILEQTLHRLTRDRIKYADFLKQFAIMTETMRINQDEFDFMYYMYGMRLPGQKKLLIEPLEYKEERRIREFVIAIDTSGSCWGETVQKFLQKTYQILKSAEIFTSQVDIYIIQCDACVQDVQKITQLNDIEAYMETLKIKGGGGTDFCPVFRYIEELRKQGMLKNICGLIYFTDGFGTFPKKQPDYKTAFALTESYLNDIVPSWALKVYWNEED